MKKFLRGNNSEEGFTLIELMIVIAIIGILAAIAIPNFIAYRNKTFCSRAEADALGLSAAISDYFAVGARTAVPAQADLNEGGGYILSGNNTCTIAGAAPNTVITITVTDASTRCPATYQAAMGAAVSPTGFWNGGVFTKLLQ